MRWVVQARPAITSGVVVSLAAGIFVSHWLATIPPGAAEMEASIRSAAGWWVALSGVGAMAAAFWVQWLSRRPIHELEGHVRALRTDLGARLRWRGDDQVARVAQAVDDLAQGISVERSSLEEDRNRLIAILESMAEGVLVTGPRRTGGLVVLANAALREMLVLDRAILGRTPMEVIRVAGLDEILHRAEKSPDGAEGEIELTGLRPGRILIRATPLQRSGSDEPHGLVAVFNDVTELRRLENVRRDFVANVSHELRTPIMAIASSTETLLGGAMADPELAHQFVAIISRHATRLRGLVEDLLELSRIEAREWRLALETLDPEPVIDATIETLAIAATERGATVTKNVEVEGVGVQADRRALEQVLVNLVDNAIKYGGVRATVEVGVQESGDRLLVTVTDHGPGIEPRHLPRLFERFYRVDPGRSRAVGGTGLGLSIVKHLVEAMRGQIEVHSRVGTGTTFTVILPRAEPDRVSHPVESTPPAPPPSLPPPPHPEPSPSLPGPAILLPDATAAGAGYVVVTAGDPSSPNGAAPRGRGSTA